MATRWPVMVGASSVVHAATRASSSATARERRRRSLTRLERVTSGRRGLFRLRGSLDRAGIEALGVGIAVDQLDHGHRRGVAVAEASLEYAGVAAAALLVALGESGEDLLDQLRVLQRRDRLPACMQAAALAQGHKLLDDATQLLGFRQRGADLLVLQKRMRHVVEHGLAMGASTAELAAAQAMAHGSLPS